jgi:hypothetical protein
MAGRRFFRLLVTTSINTGRSVSDQRGRFSNRIFVPENRDIGILSNVRCAPEAEQKFSDRML